MAVVVFFITRSAASPRLAEARTSSPCQEAGVDVASVGTTWHQRQHGETVNTGAIVGKACADTIHVSCVVHAESWYAGLTSDLQKLLTQDYGV